MCSFNKAPQYTSQITYVHFSTAFKTVVTASLEEMRYVQLGSLDQAFTLYEPKREGIIRLSETRDC